jgi:hypothetical protein
MQALAVSLAAMLVLGGLFNAAAAVLQFYGVDSMFGPMIASMGAGRGGAYGNFGQNNHFADYVTLALISVLYLQIKERLSWHAAAACCGVFLYALAPLPLHLALSVGGAALGLWFRALHGPAPGALPGRSYPFRYSAAAMR